jgi:hypothetical protein
MRENNIQPNHKKKWQRRFLKHMGDVSLALVSLAFIAGSASATPDGISDSAKIAEQAIAAEGGKKAVNEALKIARSKPALSLAAGITCIACAPVAGAAASPTMCIACGILIAKVLG